MAEAATSQSLPGKSPPEDSAGMKVWEGGLAGAGAIQIDTGSVSGLGFGAAHPLDVHIAVGPSEISSSLCSIISRRMEYLGRHSTRKRGFFSIREKPWNNANPILGMQGYTNEFFGTKAAPQECSSLPASTQPHVLVLQLLHFPIFLLLQLLDEAPEDGHLEFDVLGDLGRRGTAENGEEGDELTPSPILSLGLTKDPKILQQTLKNYVCDHQLVQASTGELLEKDPSKVSLF